MRDQYQIILTNERPVCPPDYVVRRPKLELQLLLLDAPGEVPHSLLKVLAGDAGSHQAVDARYRLPQLLPGVVQVELQPVQPNLALISAGPMATNWSNARAGGDIQSINV